ncbi:MAG: sigma-70 family RNA polymerase sigma factor [Dysgonomonas sp.]|nr:sigma-70 family RNA polymerase sigma factor [Dysgonomonas sp.]
MTESEEALLIKRLQDEKTQRDAFSVLVKTYSEQLYWQIRKIVLSHEDANDVLQNTFIKIWTNIDNFRGDSKLVTWLYKIAINESITFLNKQRQQQNIPLDDEENFLASKLESDSFFDGDEAQLLLQKAILTLPEKQRIVFNMKYFDEMKYEEMSKVLDTSVGALKASYHHAVKKIEEFLSSAD